jgi:hypothetical protein
MNSRHRVLEDILQWGRESERNNPKLEHYNAWGEYVTFYIIKNVLYDFVKCRRIDDIRVTNGWLKLQDASAEEGLISIAYERKFREWRYII